LVGICSSEIYGYKFVTGIGSAFSGGSSGCNVGAVTQVGKAQSFPGWKLTVPKLDKLGTAIKRWSDDFSPLKASGTWLIVVLDVPNQNYAPRGFRETEFSLDDSKG